MALNRSATYDNNCVLPDPDGVDQMLDGFVYHSTVVRAHVDPKVNSSRAFAICELPLPSACAMTHMLHAITGQSVQIQARRGEVRRERVHFEGA